MSMAVDTLPPAERAATALSNGAVTLLSHLRRCAFTPSCAKTDREIARATGLAQRDVIDLSDELIRAGYGVVAACTPPMGRFLTDDPDVLRGYAERLYSRGRKIMRRAHDVGRVAEVCDSRTAGIDSTGQRRLFDG